MVKRLYSWWRKRKKLIVAACLGVIALLIVIFLGYQFNWDWTGFNKSIGPQLKPNQQYRPEKTLWDWLQLLIIPVVLAVGGYLLNLTVSRNQQKITADNQSDSVLQDYLDKMSELLLQHNLLSSEAKAEVRKIARVRTLAALRGLDPARKASLLLFLAESGLIQRGTCMIDLQGADFSKADLTIAYLSSDPLKGTTHVSKRWLRKQGLVADLQKASLSGAILVEANLSGVRLNDADLSASYLSDADLIEVHLERAKLQRARLRKSIMQGAYLECANLSGAYLHYTDLSNADLRGANLSGADMKEVNLTGARYNKKTINVSQDGKQYDIPPTCWPSGFDPNLAKGICIDC